MRIAPQQALAAALLKIAAFIGPKRAHCVFLEQSEALLSVHYGKISVVWTPQTCSWLRSCWKKLGATVQRSFRGKYTKDPPCRHRTINGIVDLDILQQLLIPQIDEDDRERKFLLHTDVRELLNDRFPTHLHGPRVPQT
ncbi:hypothetical protein J6590_015505 [Homalodisca vitripennis]|nr:hypothetical protein J6590_015505 [Homalodisca vitripennis]